MKADKLLTSNVGLALVVTVIGAGFVYYSANKAQQVASDVGQAINPVNDDNIFASGVNAVGAKISGNGHWSLGGWIYDITHDDV